MQSELSTRPTAGCAMLEPFGEPMNHSLRVLAVDDDGMMREALRYIFDAEGIPIQTFASAPDLLAKADLSSPAVILLDVTMPGMSGLALQALLNERGVMLPVIFLTGSADIPTAVAAMRGGAVDFMEKSFDSAVLVYRVRRAFANIAMPPPQAARQGLPDYVRRLATLTPRERKVHDVMIGGKTSKAIARELGGSSRTVEIHRARIMSKMAAPHLALLVRMTFDAAVTA
jgi:two-component system, LuxR family, response regulator FixJ